MLRRQKGRSSAVGLLKMVSMISKSIIMVSIAKGRRQGEQERERNKGEDEDGATKEIEGIQSAQEDGIRYGNCPPAVPGPCGSSGRRCLSQSDH